MSVVVVGAGEVVYPTETFEQFIFAALSADNVVIAVNIFEPADCAGGKTDDDYAAVVSVRYEVVDTAFSLLFHQKLGVAAADVKKIGF